MRLGTLRSGHVVLITDDLGYDLTAAGPSGSAPLTMIDLLGLGLATALELVRELQSTAPVLALAELRLAAPLRPGKVIAAPINYVDHQHEMNQAHTVAGLGIFLKAPSSVIGPGELIRLPYSDRRFDHEGELAAVIGAVAKNVRLDAVGSVVFGYTCLLDITMRGGEDRSTRKSFDTFTPIGPCIVTADEVGDTTALELTCRVNGQVRQHAWTGDLIWGVPKLVEYASSVMTLLPGDVITTGTPAGVGPIENGDQVDVTISKIGTLSVGVTDEGAVLCPTLGANHGPVAPPAPTPSQARGVSATLPSEAHRDLLERPLLAHLATIRPDGTPQSNPVWYRWTGREIELSQILGSAKLRNMRANPAVSLSIVDAANPFRFLEIRGTVIDIVPDTDRSLVSALAEHYTGAPPNARLLADERVRVRIEPVRFVRELGYSS